MAVADYQPIGHYGRGLLRTSAFGLLVLHAFVLGWLPAPASAQDLKYSPLARDLAAAGINSALGGLTAATSQALAGKSFWRGFARGAGAGFVVFAGKRVIAEKSPAAWWIGRELAAIGSSEVANAASARRPFEILTIPVGPIRLHFEPRSKQMPSATIDVFSTAFAVAVGTRAGTRFAARQSLATGAIVFVTRETSNAVGGNEGGILTVSELVPNGDFAVLESEREVISHELIHSAQYDFIMTAWGDPTQSAIVKKARWLKPITRYVDFNVLLPVQFVANRLIPYNSRPWEKEASSLVSNDR